MLKLCYHLTIGSGMWACDVEQWRGVAMETGTSGPSLFMIQIVKERWGKWRMEERRSWENGITNNWVSGSFQLAPKVLSLPVMYPKVYFSAYKFLYLFCFLKNTPYIVKKSKTKRGLAPLPPHSFAPIILYKQSSASIFMIFLLPFHNILRRKVVQMWCFLVKIIEFFGSKYHISMFGIPRGNHISN